MRAESAGQHISGAETICTVYEVAESVESFTRRALSHPKGQPEKITITVDVIKDKIVNIQALPVYTTKIDTTDTAWDFARSLLLKLGISEQAFFVAKDIITSAATMRGAAVVKAVSAHRVEPDQQRGLRATRLGIDPDIKKALYKLLEKKALNVQVVSEALVLASKVAHAQGVVAELCVSDDPDYTTGYVAARKPGYVRIPKLKQKGSLWGGRVFFVREDIELSPLIEYLERTPVLVKELGRIYDEMVPEDILSLFDS